MRANPQQDIGEDVKGVPVKPPGPAVYQAAIQAIAEIHATQEREGCGNWSRDLYPFRAIITAIDMPADDESRCKAIDYALNDHREYTLTRERIARRIEAAEKRGRVEGQDQSQTTPKEEPASD